MKKLLIVFLFVITGCLTSFAKGDWIQAYEDKSYDIYFNNDITYSGGTYKVWVKWNYKTAERTDSGKVCWGSVLLEEYDRDFTKLRIISYTYYDKKGNVVETFTQDYAKWIYVVPGTIGEYLAESIEYWIKN